MVKIFVLCQSIKESSTTPNTYRINSLKTTLNANWQPFTEVLGYENQINFNI